MLSSHCGSPGIAQFMGRYRGMPLCSLGVAVPGTPSLLIDGRPGLEALLEHLIVHHGRRRLAFIGGPPGNPEGELRFEIYRNVLERHGMVLDPALVAAGHFVRNGGEQAMRKILAHDAEIDAVVAANDIMALAAIEVLRKSGRSVPQDIPVTGFDDLAQARLGNPPLTTVAQPFDLMAEVGIGLVLEQLGGRSVRETTEIPTKVILRHSCGCGPYGSRSATRLAPDPSLNAAEYLRQHAQSIQSVVAGCMGRATRDGSAYAARLVAALQTELDGQASSFLRTLDEMIVGMGDDNDFYRALQSAISCLRQALQDVATAELADLWFQALGRLAMANTTTQVLHRIRVDDDYLRLLTAGEQVAVAFDFPSLQTILEKSLPAVGIFTAVVSRYLKGSSSELEPFVCVLDGCPVKPATARLASGELVPSGFWPDRRHTAVVFPLVFETQAVGTVVFEYAPAVGGYPMLRDQMAAALATVGLHEQLVEKTMLHERSVQERLATTKRMQSLSVLAGGVAHDLNNALGPMVALPDVMLRALEEIDQGQPAAQDLRLDIESIKEASLRAAQTIKDLLTLGRQGRTTKEALDLRRVVGSCLAAESLRFLTQSNRQVTILTDLPPEPLVIRGSEAHLARAITNLVRNSVDAITGAGEVVVKAFGARLAEPFGGYETVEPGDYVAVTVTDNGGGIGPAELGRVFEPFFSRKRLREHSGSGLGLAIVHGVVKEHEGFVDVSSTLGRGTRFTLYFPRMDATVTVVERNLPTRISGAKILIVDDEPTQLRTGQRVLAHIGYQVDVVISGAKACALFEQAAASGVSSPYDLILLDMVLEGSLDGLSVYERIQQLFPGQRAIVVSGYAAPERAELALQKGLLWLVKPYTADALAEAVDAALAVRRSLVTLSCRPPASG